MAVRFRYDYSEDEIDGIADWEYDLAAKADAVHVVFNNNARDFALKAAGKLRQRLGQIARCAVPRLPKQGTLF